MFQLWRYAKIKGHICENAKCVSSTRTFSTIQNQRSFVEWASKQLNVKEMSDWYSKTKQVTSLVSFVVNCKDLDSIDKEKALDQNQSLPQILSDVFPEYNWLPWKFNACPPSYWDDPSNQRKFLDWVSAHYGIKNQSDWTKLTPGVHFYTFTI